jgi:GAF domain-containing protein
MSWNDEIEAVRIRAQKAMQESHELIRQRKELQTRAITSLGEFDRWIAATRETQNHIAGERRAPLYWALAAAMRATNASMGNVQLADESSGTLNIVVHSGFGPGFLNFFDRVQHGEAACGAAFRKRDRIVVEDVTESGIFRDSTALEVLLDANVRSVQSTPVLSRSGSVLAVISTHWSTPHCPDNRQLDAIDFLSRTLGELLEHGSIRPC